MRKALPKLEFDSGKLLEFPYNALKWEILKTGIQLNIFDLLSSPVSSAEIADKLSLNKTNTEYMLNSLVAMGCLTKTENRFMNTIEAEKYLTTRKDTSLGESLIFFESWSTPLMNGGLLELVKKGPFSKNDIADPELWEKGARLSVNHARCGRAQLIARLVSDLPEFSSFKKFLDLGAGPGVVSVAVAEAHPTITCAILEQPPVAAVAEEVVAEYGLEDRISVKAGDYMQDDIGTGYDLVMANYTLNFYQDKIDMIMNKVYAALNPGGVFLVASDGISSDGTEPVGTVISWLPVKLQGNDVSMQSGKIAMAMLAAGFESIEKRTVTGHDSNAFGPMEMTIGKKETSLS